MQKVIGRPREWRSETLSSLRVPKTTVPAIRAVAHAIDNGVLTEAQVMEWLLGVKERSDEKHLKTAVTQS